LGHEEMFAFDRAVDDLVEAGSGYICFSVAASRVVGCGCGVVAGGVLRAAFALPVLAQPASGRAASARSAFVRRGWRRTDRRAERIKIGRNILVVSFYLGCELKYDMKDSLKSEG
jgi:hypothetical protein